MTSLEVKSPLTCLLKKTRLWAESIRMHAQLLVYTVWNFYPSVLHKPFINCKYKLKYREYSSKAVQFTKRKRQELQVVYYRLKRKVTIEMEH